MIDQIEYIKKLGVDSIWFSPFYKNGKDPCHDLTDCDSNDQNYDWSDITDHKMVGKMFGTDQDLDKLLELLEEKGWYYIIP